MTAPTLSVPLPCAGQHRLYDRARGRPAGSTSDDLEAARWEASTLCGRCPAPCRWPVKAPRTRNRYARAGRPKRVTAA